MTYLKCHIKKKSLDNKGELFFVSKYLYGLKPTKSVVKYPNDFSNLVITALLQK